MAENWIDKSRPKGGTSNRSPFTVQDIISKRKLTNDQLRQSSQRLYSAKTKSFARGRPIENQVKIQDTFKEPNPVGYGQKLWPHIEGLETRFKGTRPARSATVFDRLFRTQTKSGQAKYRDVAIPLYPEKAVLMSNKEHAKTYHDTGSIPKQVVLARSEKWFR